MDGSIEEFIGELDSGEYAEKRFALINQYRKYAEGADTPKAAAIVGMEFADRLSLLTLSQYGDWIKRNR